MEKEKHFSKEKTLIIIKPDGIQRSLVGEIIKRYERIGLKMMAMKMLVPEPDHVEKHYTLDPNWRKVTGEKTIAGYKAKGMKPPTEDPFEVTDKLLKNLRYYFSSGPVIAMVWQGAHSVVLGRKLAGGTEPLTSDVGTIRGDYVLDSYQMSDTDDRSIRNLIHASGSVEEAEMEIKHWFKKEELTNYNIFQEKVLYDVNLDGVLE
jgi:nucleoside-diphosphate kinase